MKSSVTGLTPIEGGSKPFWVIPEAALEHLEKTSAAILKASQNVVAKDNARILLLLVEEARAISYAGVEQKWNSQVAVRWEYIAEIEFAMLSVIRARMKAHLGLHRVVRINALPKDVAIEKGLTPDLVKEALEESVPCANTFTELANLIRGLAYEPQEGLTPVEMDAIRAKTMVSANQLGPEIECAVGVQQAAEFCDEVKRAFGDIGSRSRNERPLFGLGLSATVEAFCDSLVQSIEPTGLLSRLFSPHIKESLIKRLEQWQSKKVIEIMAEDFSDSKSFRLLVKIIADDIQRNGVEVTRADVKSLKDLLRKRGYPHVIKNLKYKKGKLRTTIPPGQITIIPKK